MTPRLTLPQTSDLKLQGLESVTVAVGLRDAKQIPPSESERSAEHRRNLVRREFLPSCAASRDSRV